MNWEYVAGFFDGEGCIHIDRERNRYSVTLTQLPRSDSVLRRIQEFWISMGIACFVHKNSRTGVEHMGTGNLAGMHVALTSMLPHLIVKLEKALELLAIIEPKLYRRKEWQEKLDQAIQDYLNGESSLQIFKKYGICHATLGVHLNKRQMAMRTRKEANQLAYGRRSPEAKENIYQGAQNANKAKHLIAQSRYAAAPLMYTAYDMTITDIAKFFHVSYPTMRRQLLAFGVTLRNRTEADQRAWITRRAKLMLLPSLRLHSRWAAVPEPYRPIG